jgi:hypothetical protein
MAVALEQAGHEFRSIRVVLDNENLERSVRHRCRAVIT